MFSGRSQPRGGRLKTDAPRDNSFRQHRAWRVASTGTSEGGLLVGDTKARPCFARSACSRVDSAPPSAEIGRFKHPAQRPELATPEEPFSQRILFKAVGPIPPRNFCVALKPLSASLTIPWPSAPGALPAWTGGQRTVLPPPASHAVRAALNRGPPRTATGRRQGAGSQRIARREPRAFQSPQRATGSRHGARPAPAPRLGGGAGPRLGGGRKPVRPRTVTAGRRPV